MIVTQSTPHGDLNGLRVLVVEDEAAISLLLEDMLLDFGCEVVGPAARLGAALALVRDETVDLAILDVNVAGEPIYPVVSALADMKVPFVFSTGYGSAGIRISTATGRFCRSRSRNMTCSRNCCRRSRRTLKPVHKQESGRR